MHEHTVFLVLNSTSILYTLFLSAFPHTHLPNRERAGVCVSVRECALAGCSLCICILCACGLRLVNFCVTALERFIFSRDFEYF